MGLGWGGRVRGRGARPPCGGCWRDTGAAGWSSLCCDSSGFPWTARTLRRKRSGVSPEPANSPMRRSFFSSCNAGQMIPRGAEQTGKPTYPRYSSMPIEQASGPKAAQRQAETGSRNTGVLDTEKPDSTLVRVRAPGERSDLGWGSEEDSQTEGR